ncbi:hypothetical protein B0O80DRAFT_484189 [Mortierella sp. GBAus27b]|nr:hypothetical protein B0O80DRAFT_484189 [Mortierella sp. GBAus27b]
MTLVCSHRLQITLPPHTSTMLGPINLFILASAFLYSQGSLADPSPKDMKRDLVYLTRYVPVQVPGATSPEVSGPPSMQAYNYPAAQPQSWNQAPAQPAAAPLGPSWMYPPPNVQMGAPYMTSAQGVRPMPFVVPPPRVQAGAPAVEPGATWQPPPPNDALTYTSYAGLLSTKAPAFYPAPLSVPPVVDTPVPTPAPVPVYTASAYTPEPVVTPDSRPNRPTPEAAPSHLPTPPPETMASFTAAATATTTPGTTATTTGIHTSATSESSVSDPEETSTTDETSKETPTKTRTRTTTDVTVTTTTTTRGDTTHTTTTVGSDGTTTVLTQYPTSTPCRTPTSGAQSMHPRRQLLPRPTDESTLGYLTDVLISHPKFILTVMAMMGAVFLPGAMFVMA